MTAAPRHTTRIVNRARRRMIMASIFCLLAIEITATMPATADGEIRQPMSVLPVQQRFAPIDESVPPLPIGDPATVSWLGEHDDPFREPVIQFEAEFMSRQPGVVVNPAQSGDVLEERLWFSPPSASLTPRPMNVLRPPAGRCHCHSCRKKSRTQTRRSSCSSPGYGRRN